MRIVARDRWLNEVIRRFGVVAGAAGVLVASGVSFAQDDTPPLSMNVTEQVRKAENYNSEMKLVLKSALDLLQEARSEQDIQKLNCINESLAAVKGLLNLSEKNLIGLQEAASRRDEKAAEHEFVKISIAYGKVRELDGRVRSCGSPNVDTEVDGRPIIDRVVDPDMPTEDPLGGIIELPFDQPRPPSASPWF